VVASELAVRRLGRRTQLQDGWAWNPSSNEPLASTGAFNPAYWAWTDGGRGEAVGNESWAPIATGGGAMVIYARPSWQQGVDPGYGDHRLVPDTAWNAAVNGGVDFCHRLSGLQLGQYYGLLDDLRLHVGGDTADRRARRPGQRRPGVAGQAAHRAP
jgi:hypothetical protein